MKFLHDLRPEWLGLLRPESGEGISFDCPTCGPKHRLVVYFSNPRDHLEAASWQATLWKRTEHSDFVHTLVSKLGPVFAEFGKLTIEPSINYPCFHGWVEQGRVFSVTESVLTIPVMVNGAQQLAALSHMQAQSLSADVQRKLHKVFDWEQV